MFSGIITDLGLISFFDKNKNIIQIKTNYDELFVGESISCSGVCLTVDKKEKKTFFANLSVETIKKTNLINLNVGDKINLEKSLKLGQDISGHLVFGHVDGLCRIKQISNKKSSWIFEIEAKQEIIKYMSPKCSVALDGISLTVNDVKKKSFNVCIIPHTMINTSLQKNKVGDYLNIEIDMLARYVFRALNK